jgi:hypothetical protein
MSSNMFINHAAKWVHNLYKIFGIRFTNFLINRTAGELFTSGETL